MPLAGEAADRDFAPEYPGITESNSLHDWDPPFPLDLRRVRPIDEQYWKQYRTTPKAFIPLARGQQLWGTRFGRLTSIRIFPPSDAYAGALRAALDPAQMGLMVLPVKARALEAAHGATDFGEYFVYFSFFLMVSALLLTGLFFKLGVEQRMREIGVLRALGFSIAEDPVPVSARRRGAGGCRIRCWGWRVRWRTRRSSCSGCGRGGWTRSAPGCWRCILQLPRWPWEQRLEL